MHDVDSDGLINDDGVGRRPRLVRAAADLAMRAVGTVILLGCLDRCM